MSGIQSYDLDSDAVKSLVRALEGNVPERIKWLKDFTKWLIHRNLQMEIYRLTEKWMTDFATRTHVHLGRHDWETDEENLRSWVYYQMEYISGIVWDASTRKCIINKYASSRPLLNAENTTVLLDFLTEEIGKITT